MTWLGRVAMWAGPVALASVVNRVFRGEPDAPLLVLLAIVAPLAALVRPAERLPMTPLSAGLALPGLALVLSANLLLIAQGLGMHDIPAPVAVLVGVLILLAPVVVVAPTSGASWLTAAGIAGIVLPVLAVAHATAAAPWTAWARTASRPAIVFSEDSPAVAGGRPIGAAGVLAFTEPHRVTAVAPGAVRIFENDGDHRRIHERRLGSGDSILIRPGDSLLLEDDARLRFERGKRIPGAALSGPAWADPPHRQEPEVVLGMVGLAVTIVGGALALVGPAPVRVPGRRPHETPPAMVAGSRASRKAAVVAAVLLAMVVLAAGSLGVYAMDGAPELLLGATLPTALLEAPAALAPSYGDIMDVLTGGALVILFASMAFVLASRVHEVVSMADARRAATSVPLVWAALVGVAAVGTLWGGDPWTLWLIGLGLLAVGWAAPALGARDERGAIAGGVVGVGVLAGLLWLSPAGSPWAVAGAAPALVAAPLACAVARLLSHEARSRGRVAAPARR